MFARCMTKINEYFKERHFQSVVWDMECCISNRETDNFLEIFENNPQLYVSQEFVNKIADILAKYGLPCDILMSMTLISYHPFKDFMKNNLQVIYHRLCPTMNRRSLTYLVRYFPELLKDDVGLCTILDKGYSDVYSVLLLAWKGKSLEQILYENPNRWNAEVNTHIVRAHMTYTWNNAIGRREHSSVPFNPLEPKPDPKIVVLEELATTEEEKCIVCRENKRIILLMPCRHNFTCKSCSEKLTLCPICRHEVKERMEIYR